ncbi:MAG: metal-dependent hydrolase [Bacteroidetes bacterium]|nr:metal-dependent hydrolase [Bacteroidota bacterium]
MDSLTHIVLGASLGELIAGKKLGKKAMLIGALADTIPDFDVFANPFVPPVDALLIHRGITHSVLFAVLAPFVFAWLFQLLFKKREVDYITWYLLFFVGFASHIFIDSLTAYGTALFEPFDNHRISLHTIFVADLLYTLPLLVCAIALLVVKNKRVVWATSGIAISTIYIFSCMFNKMEATNQFQIGLKAQNISYNRLIATPTPLNNVLWTAIAQTDSGAWTAYYSKFDDQAPKEFCYLPQNKHLLDSVEDVTTIEKLKLFSDDFYCVTTKDGKLKYVDLRFGQVGGWHNCNAPFAFEYTLTRGADNKMILEKGRWNSSSLKDELNKLWLRIKGK